MVLVSNYKFEFLLVAIQGGTAMEEPTEIFTRKREREVVGLSLLFFGFFSSNLKYPKQCAYEGKESINQVCVLWV